MIPFVSNYVGVLYNGMVKKVLKEEIDETMEVYIDEMILKYERKKGITRQASLLRVPKSLVV